MCRRASNVRPSNTPKEMFAGRVARSPLVSHVEYAPRALLKLEKTLRALLTLERKTGQRRADGRIPDRNTTLNARRGQLNNFILLIFVRCWSQSNTYITFTGSSNRGCISGLCIQALESVPPPPCKTSESWMRCGVE